MTSNMLLELFYNLPLIPGLSAVWSKKKREFKRDYKMLFHAYIWKATSSTQHIQIVAEDLGTNSARISLVIYASKNKWDATLKKKINFHNSSCDTQVLCKTSELTYSAKQLFFQFYYSVYPAQKTRSDASTWICQPTSQKMCNSVP